MSALAMTMCGCSPKSQERLLEACSRGDIVEVRKLVRDGVDIDYQGKNGETALMIAAGKGHRDIVAFLIGKGANIYLTDRSRGRNAFMIAAACGKKRVIDRLLQAGVDIERKDRYGNTALYHAILSGSPEVVGELVSRKANVNAGCIEGTLLSTTVKRGDNKSLVLLLNGEADPDGISRNGTTPLMVAAIFEKRDCARSLLKHDAKVNTVRNDGHTALDFAVANHDKEMIDLLRKYGAKTAAELDPMAEDKTSKFSQESERGISRKD